MGAGELVYRSFYLHIQCYRFFEMRQHRHKRRNIFQRNLRGQGAERKVNLLRELIKSFQTVIHQMNGIHLQRSFGQLDSKVLNIGLFVIGNQFQTQFLQRESGSLFVKTQSFDTKIQRVPVHSLQRDVGYNILKLDMLGIKLSGSFFLR